ncbi:hypothetical protein JF55_15060 [Pseudomonas sp. 1-7]|nr:hypothetical protein JF55_15060 [Pseudomonas sp. 1-7]
MAIVLFHLQELLTALKNIELFAAINNKNIALKLASNRASSKTITDYQSFYKHHYYSTSL